MQFRDRSRIPAGGLLLLAILALGAGCGGGGGPAPSRLVAGGTALAEGLVVERTALPTARVGTDYGPARLAVRHAGPAPLTWRVWSGALPDGLQLTPEGALEGTPREPGLAVFSVHVSDGERAGIATRAVAVDTFGIYARTGLVHGEAWRGHPVELVAVGAEGLVDFQVVASASGGRLTQVDVEAGSAVWVPGGAGEGLVEDMIEAYDEGTGRVHRVGIPVREDPMTAHEADFASTDVWYVHTTGKHGRHAYAHDFHDALARIGLRGRGPASHDAFGRCVDMLAAQCVRLALLRELARLFLDGGAGTLPISFPYHEPGEGFARPADGTAAPGAPALYSQIALGHRGQTGALGIALSDHADNRNVENDTTGGELDLGVFLDALLPFYRFYYRSDLELAPIGPEDADALHALLHGLPHPGGRYDRIRSQVGSFARVLAIITAHEIGHSLGLGHSAEDETDALMSTTARIRPWDDPRFTAADLVHLRRALPGPGRGLRAPERALSTGAAAGVASTCPRGTCHLHPPR